MCWGTRDYGLPLDRFRDSRTKTQNKIEMFASQKRALEGHSARFTNYGSYQGQKDIMACRVAFGGVSGIPSRFS